MVPTLCAVLMLSGLTTTATPPQREQMQEVQQIQQRQAPPRDPTGKEKKGTGVIKGRVTSADSGRPLRRAQIRITAPEVQEARSVSTNSTGWYEARDLPPGRYTIAAIRSGYLRLQYGQRRPGEAGKPLQLSDGQTVEKIDFALPRMSIISGRVLDELGEPIAGVMVFPIQLRYFQGRRRLVPVGGSARSDDTGQYRLISLEPGDYYVMGSIRETWVMEGDEKQVLSFAPTYFPGVTSASEAQLVRVAVGQEAAGIDFSLLPGRVVKITGTARSSLGVPLAGETVSLNQEFVGPGSMMMFGSGEGGKVLPDGSFTINNVAPGEYKVSVRAPADKDRPAEAASVPVTVIGADIEGITLFTSSGGTVTGRVVTDTGALPSFSPSRTRVVARPVNTDFIPRGLPSGQDSGRIRDDWTFELSGIMGPQRLNVTSLPDGWAVKTIDADGRDLADVPIELRSGQTLSGVTIVLTNRFPRISGRLTDDREQPAEGTVIVFPDEAAKWSEESRGVKTARPDQSGLFEVKALPPGQYLAIALDYVPEGQWNDPEFLEGLRSRATRVTLAEGQIEQMNLKVKQ